MKQKSAIEETKPTEHKLSNVHRTRDKHKYLNQFSIIDVTRNHSNSSSPKMCETNLHCIL